MHIVACLKMVSNAGGVSMGDKDLVKPLLEHHGRVHFGKVRMMRFTNATEVLARCASKRCRIFCRRLMIEEILLHKNIQSTCRVQSKQLHMKLSLAEVYRAMIKNIHAAQDVCCRYCSAI